MQKHVGEKHGYLQPKKRLRKAENPSELKNCRYCGHKLIGKTRDVRRKTLNKHL
jgi:DNA-directed RNA polymerase subunit RPC12/RpoP